MSEKGRFDFGSNWERFLATVNEEKIKAAETSLGEMLKEDVRGKNFLDAGCGSGLFSLAAARLGARVHSFDYDPGCVSCAGQLKKRYLSNAAGWTIEQGSVLDDKYLDSLGQFDVVYSWGVLHHTGNMARAIDLTARRVKANGLFFISIYNDQGLASVVWLKIKQFYNWLPAFLRFPLVMIIASPFEIYASLFGHRHKKDRGMSRWHDWVDWCGGLPFEVATVDKITEMLREKGFVLENLKPTSRWGCNEFVFRRTK